MEQTVKKRGRKKKELNVVEVVEEPVEEVVKKKRGRKKKWETTTFKSNYIDEKKNEEITFDVNEQLNNNYLTNSLSFGNLCIQVHDKEKEESTNISDFFEPCQKECNIIVSSDEEDTCDIVKDNVKSLKHYNMNIDVTQKKQAVNNIRCYNCHHTFSNIPFYLPINYCPKLKRYKLFGNFCSPNCVKSFCLNNKIFENKSYLVGQFYRSLFGQDFRIPVAPSIYTLKEYGGDKSIDEFRKLSYTNSGYTMNNINTKIINLS